MTKDIKAGKLEALSKHHKKNMKTEFSAETFTKECRTTGQTDQLEEAETFMMIVN